MNPLSKVQLYTDSRDKHFYIEVGHVDIPTLPNEFDCDAGLLNEIERPEEVCCTAISATSVATDQTGKIYDYIDLFAKTPHSDNGATPQDSMGAMCKLGLLVKGTLERVKEWSGYYRADTGQYDIFDNIRATIYGGKTSTTVASNYYREWTDNQIMPIGKTKVSAHDYKISGWKQINSQPMLIVKDWTGVIRYMPRETCNTEMKKLGCCAFIPLNRNGAPVIHPRGLPDYIFDMIINLILRLRQWISLQK